MRADKWIWAVRMVKSRTLAGDLCKRGRVIVNEEKVKASKIIRAGDVIQVTQNGKIKIYQVLDFLEKRASAKVVKDYFDDLTEEVAQKNISSDISGACVLKGAGRPTKKQRRQIDKFLSNMYSYEEYDEI